VPHSAERLCSLQVVRLVIKITYTVLDIKTSLNVTFSRNVWRYVLVDYFLLKKCFKIPPWTSECVFSRLLREGSPD
jgi:hypothetical protein